jgi:hypothetical protein
MKNAVFWDIKTQFIPHRGHITTPLQSPAGKCYVRFVFFTAVTIKNALFWDLITVHTSQETQYLSPTDEPINAM